MRVRTGSTAAGWLLACGVGVAQIIGGVGGGGGVKGQPYSAIEKTTTVRTLGDGTTITNNLEMHVARDSEGRQRTEIGMERNGEIQFNTVSIFDPVARETMTLNATTKTARIFHMPEPKPIDPAKLAEMRAKAVANRASHQQQVNPPTIEKLGGQTVAGVYAEGRRTTRVIPAGKEGNDREIRTVTEEWISPDLKIVVGRTMDDPRMGKSTMVMTDLKPGDPDPSLFQVPANYKVIEQQPRMGAQ